MNGLLEKSILEKNSQLNKDIVSHYNPFHEKKEDAQIKWCGVIEAFLNLGIHPETVIDLGSGVSNQILYLKTIVPNVYSIDAFLTKDYFDFLINAGIKVYAGKVEDCDCFQKDSIDCIVDSCAIGCSMDLDRVLQKVSTWLKPGGYFISAGDSDLHEYSLPFPSPDLWIDTAKKYGLQLVGEGFSHSNLDSAYWFPYGRYKLYIARFVFQKPVRPIE